ncbi:MAG: HpcH/HpaI aldolase/citrate lyase family protein [Dehalococcoidia bacterium]
MNGAELKATLKAGGRVFGTMISHGQNPRWVSALEGTGLDYIVIDSEHSPRDRSDMADYLAAFNGSSIVPIVRIPIPDSHYVTMALDAGAHGVLAPYCETVEQVKAVVGAAKWRPLKGEAVRKLMDGQGDITDATRTYLEDRNQNSIAIIGIESVAAVRNLEDILHVPGIDAIFVGPNDMSISVGFPDQYDRLEYKDTVKHVIDTSEAHGIPVLVHHQTMDLSTYWVTQGARFILHTSDRRTLAEAYRRDFTELRRVAEDL